ncbi:MAG: hypothetical protein U0271_17020 [Polyangiaceae bacterium]
MSRRELDPTVVARGSIRVDATRAARKIRDHLLAEPAAWLCEVARAAKLGGATTLDVRFDASRVVARWDGEPLPRASIQNLAAQIVAGESDDERRAQLLAIAVFGALGHEAASATLHARTREGGVAATSIDRRELDADPGGAVDRTPPPPEPEDDGGLSTFSLVVKRPRGLRGVARAVTRAVPEEVTLLAQRISERGVRLRVEGEWQKPPSVQVLVSVAAPGGVEEVLVEALAGEARAQPEVHVYELGVELARVPLAQGSWLGSSVDGVFVPLRVVVHADRLSTNVSRSRVHDDVFARILASAAGAMPEVYSALRATVVSAANPDGSATATSRAAVNALGTIGAILFGAESSGVAAPENPTVAAFAPSRKLPLLADAVGRPRTFEDLVRYVAANGTHSYFVYRGRAALPRGHAPFVDDVFWSRGDAADRALRGAPFETIASFVESGVARRARALATPTEPLSVTRHDDHLAVQAFEEADGFSAVVAVREKSRLGGATLRVWVDGHPIETLRVTAKGVLFDAAVSWPNTLRFERTYDRVERGPAVERALARVEACASLALAAHAPSMMAARASEVRAAVCAVVASKTGAVEALEALELWPTLAHGTITLSAVRTTVSIAGGLSWVTPAEAHEITAASLPTPAWAIVVLDAPDLGALQRALALKSGSVSNVAAALRRTRTTEAQLTALVRAEIEQSLGGELATRWPITSWEEDGRRIAATFGERALTLRMHRGAVIRRDDAQQVALATAQHLVLAIDEDDAPSPQREAVRLPKSRVHARILSAFGAKQAEQATASWPAWLRSALRASAALVHDDPEILRALASLRIFDVASGRDSEVMSANELAAIYDKSIPVSVTRSPDLPVGAVVAILPLARDAKLLRTLARRTTHEPNLEELRARATVERDIAVWRARPVWTRAELDLRSRPIAPVVSIAADPSTHLRGGFCALAPVPAPQGGANVVVLFEGREVSSLLVSHALAGVVAIVDVDSVELVPGHAPLEELTRFYSAVLDATSEALASALLATAHAFDPFDDEAAMRVVAHASERPSSRVPGLLGASDRLARTVQGESAPLRLLLQERPYRIGRDLRDPWPRRTPATRLDEPILYVRRAPSGDALLCALQALARTSRTEVEDLSAELAALVEARSVVRAQPAVAAIERASSPLRTSVAGLGVPFLEGELELVAGRVSTLRVATDRGELVPLATLIALPELPCAVDAVLTFRVPDRLRLVAQFVAAVARHVRSLALHLEEFADVGAGGGPSPRAVVRSCARSCLIWMLVRRETIARSLAAVPVFPLHDGGFASLADLAQHHPSDLAIPLRELRTLAPHVAFAAAPAVVGAAAADATHTFSCAGGISGEGMVFVHGRSSAKAAGVRVTCDGLVLGTVAKVFGFRAQGDVTVSDLSADELDAVGLSPLLAERVVSALSAALVQAFSAATLPPTTSLAGLAVETRVRDVDVAGWLTISSGSGRAVLTVTCPAGVEQRTIRRNVGPPEARVGRDVVLPIGGALVASAPLSPADLDALVIAWFPRLFALLAPQPRAEISWYFALVAPDFRASLDPSTVPSGEIAAALRTVRILYLDPTGTDHAFTPAGLNVGGQHPLGRALLRFSPGLLQRMPIEQAPPLPPIPAAPSPAAPQGVDEHDTAQPPPRFLDGFLRLFGVHPTWRAPSTHRIHKGLVRLINGMSLPDGVTLAFSSSGRPVRYDASDNQIVLNPAHPHIDALVTAGDFVALAVAAMSEVDRTLERVTPADERRAIEGFLGELEPRAPDK